LVVSKYMNLSINESEYGKICAGAHHKRYQVHGKEVFSVQGCTG
jgi:hypothetical protein